VRCARMEWHVRRLRNDSRRSRLTRRVQAMEGGPRNAVGCGTGLSCHSATCGGTSSGTASMAAPRVVCWTCLVPTRSQAQTGQEYGACCAVTGPAASEVVWAVEAGPTKSDGCAPWSDSTSRAIRTYGRQAVTTASRKRRERTRCLSTKSERMPYQPRHQCKQSYRDNPEKDPHSGRRVPAELDPPYPILGPTVGSGIPGRPLHLTELHRRRRDWPQKALSIRTVPQPEGSVM